VRKLHLQSCSCCSWHCLASGSVRQPVRVAAYAGPGHLTDMDTAMTRVGAAEKKSSAKRYAAGYLDTYKALDLAAIKQLATTEVAGSPRNHAAAAEGERRRLGAMPDGGRVGEDFDLRDDDPDRESGPTTSFDDALTNDNLFGWQKRGEWDTERVGENMETEQDPEHAPAIARRKRHAALQPAAQPPRQKRKDALSLGVAQKLAVVRGAQAAVATETAAAAAQAQRANALLKVTPQLCTGGATFALLALPDEILLKMLTYAHNLVETHTDSHIQLVPELGIHNFGRLNQTCRHFHRRIPGRDGYSGPIIEVLAHGCIREREQARGCQRANYGQRVMPREGETWLQMLRQLNRFDRMPLDFTLSAPADTRGVVRFEDDMQPGGVGRIKLTQCERLVTAIAGHDRHRMRDGVHYAEFTVVQPGRVQDSMHVGIVQADFDNVDEAAAHTPLGWAWNSHGACWHDACVHKHFADAGAWGRAGDVLTLELDCDRGRLTGWRGSELVGTIAVGLDTCPLPGGRAREFCWSVSMGGAEIELRIRRAAPQAWMYAAQSGATAAAVSSSDDEASSAYSSEEELATQMLEAYLRRPAAKPSAEMQRMM
jgi:hypothetical protein